MTYDFETMKGDLFYMSGLFSSNTGAQLLIDIQFLVRYRGNYRDGMVEKNKNEYQRGGVFGL